MLPELCSKCRQLTPADQGSFVVKDRRRFFICNACHKKNQKRKRLVAGKTHRESPAERSLRTFLTDEGYRPVCEYPIEEFQYDFAWPRWRLLIELDSKRYHTATAKKIRDRQKDAMAIKHDWLLVRVSAGRWMKSEALQQLKQRISCFDKNA